MLWPSRRRRSLWPIHKSLSEDWKSSAGAGQDHLRQHPDLRNGHGFAEAEPFDLLLPSWSVVMIAMLVNCAEEVRQEGTIVLLRAPFEADSAMELSPNCNL